MTTTTFTRTLTFEENAWMQTKRPWLTLYGLRVKAKTSEQKEKQKAVELAPIQKLLPEEMLLQAFSKLPPYCFGKVACVCKHWSSLAAHSALWEAACREAFSHTEGQVGLERLYKHDYKRNWRSLFLQRAHVRFDGLYVSRNTYIRTGITEWRVKNPVHMVCYFRYQRFFPDGRFLYRTSPEVVSKVAKTMKIGPGVGKSEESLQIGRWGLREDRLLTAMEYPNVANTQIRTRLNLRSTTPGANNRLDIVDISSYDLFDNTSTCMLGLGSPREEDMLAEGGLSHRRGLSSYVFVPDDQVATHILNQSDISKMDFYLPG